MANISPVCESRKALVAFPQKPASLHRQLAAAMGRRQVAVVCPPGRDDPDPGETFYIVRGDLIAELGYVDGDGGDFHDRYFADVDIVPGTVVAATATV